MTTRNISVGETKQMSLTNTNKHNNDFWYTPSIIRDGVLSLLKDNETKLLDPCAGACDLCDLDKYDYELFDLNPQHPDVKKGDFFNLSKTDRTIVMNPPFSIGRRFIEHALDIADTVIVICPFTCVKPFRSFITDWCGEYWWKSAFYITHPVAAFRLERRKTWTWGYDNKWDSLFTFGGRRHISDLEKLSPNETRTGIVFNPPMLGTFLDWNAIDPRTGFTYWVSPLNDNTRNILTYYQKNCKGHKAGDIKEYAYFLPVDDVENAYKYFTTCYPTTNWYKVHGILNTGLSIDIPEEWKPTWDTEDKGAWALKTFGEDVVNDKGF